MRQSANWSRWDDLLAAGVLHPPVEAGDPFEDWPDIRLPAGTAAALIDADRGQASVSRRRPVRTRAVPHSRGPIAGHASLRYMESSALVAALLEHDTTGLRKIPRGAQQVTSALTLAEAGRAIIRARTGGRLTADQERAAVRALRTFERRSFILDVDRAVLDRVRRPFPVEPVRTLGAIHLATAELLGEAPQLITVVTRDARVDENARALGFAVE